MDIFNRTPSIPEDTLQFALYPPADFSDKASVTTFAACMHAYIDSLLPGFLWHRDSFQLKVVADLDGKGSLLEGRMRVGDCVDDEWCVVWLLREISAKWDVAISVFDSDGEFLLIEAAEALPAWVKPTNSENRVWIYSSRLHLVPLSHVSSPSKKSHRRRFPGTKESDDEMEEEDATDYVDVNDALTVVRDPTIDTHAPAEIERIVWQRIAGYPTAATDHVHLTKAYLPIDVARALSVNPSLIQKPVETFYTRDAIQLRAVHRMSRFPPQPSVLRTVKMTRTAYAQLLGQKFYPPKIFGRWQEKEGTHEWRWQDAGMKIASGFEMLYQESKGRSDPSTSTAEGVKSSAEARKEALRRNPDYIKYIQNLVFADYFRGELNGSELWNSLEDRAASIFVETRREDDSTRPSFASIVTIAITQADPDILTTHESEDSDDWLNVDAQDFDDMLKRTLSLKDQSQTDPLAMDIDIREDEDTQEDRLAKEQASRLQGLAHKVEDFVEGEGDLDGAVLDDERSADGEFSDEEFSDERMTDSDDEMPDEDQIARQAAMDKLVPGLEASEYGRMPASYHSNSQKVAPTTVETDVVELLHHDEPPSASEPHVKPIRQPILPRDKYDGVDSDDQTDEEDIVGDDDESEEDQPQVVGDIEIDMGEEEEEFLEFSRQALGISDAEWAEIIRDRKSRGAFVPTTVTVENKAAAKVSMAAEGKQPALTGGERQPRVPAEGPRPNANPNLDSFEAVMHAMDAELFRSRKSNNPKTPPHMTEGKGKARAECVEEEEDIEAAMDAELKAALEKEADDDEKEEEPMAYNLIKNFLESFKSQGGLSGPVSNLAGRLQPGLQLPRDDS